MTCRNFLRRFDLAATLPFTCSTLLSGITSENDNTAYSTAQSPIPLRLRHERISGLDSNWRTVLEEF